MLVEFCLPIKNEGKILRQNLERLLSYCSQQEFSFSWRIIGVINGSSDDSAMIMHEFKEKFPDYIDYFEVPQSGRGGALKKYWQLSKADVLAYMDADLAVSLNHLNDLVHPIICTKSDMVIGSRLVAGAKVGRSIGRELVSRMYNFLSWLFLRCEVADLQCGFKAISADVFRRLLPLLQDDYWFFDTELVVLAKRHGYRVQEIPVDWQESRFEKRSSTVKVVRDSWTFLKNLKKFRSRLRSRIN